MRSEGEDDWIYASSEAVRILRVGVKGTKESDVA